MKKNNNRNYRLIEIIEQPYANAKCWLKKLKNVISMN